MGIKKSDILRKSGSVRDVYIENLGEEVALRVLNVAELEEVQEEALERMNDEGMNGDTIKKISELEEKGEINNEMSKQELLKVLRKNNLDVDVSKVMFNKDQNEFMAKVVAAGLSVGTDEEEKWGVKDVKQLNMPLFMELYYVIMNLTGKSKSEEIQNFRTKG